MIRPAKPLFDLSSSRGGVLRGAVAVAGVSLVTAAAAQIQVPLLPVPFSLQTLPVLLSGLLLGARRGYLAQLLYLAAGICGAPVFQGGASGISAAAGATGGYLMAFPICAIALGLMTEAGWTKTFRGTFLALLLGNAIIFGLGWSWLSLSIGPVAAWQGGVAPFLVSNAAQSAVAFCLLPGVWSGSFRRGE